MGRPARSGLVPDDECSSILALPLDTRVSYAEHVERALRCSHSDLAVVLQTLRTGRLYVALQDGQALEGTAIECVQRCVRRIVDTATAAGSALCSVYWLSEIAQDTCAFAHNTNSTALGTVCDAIQRHTSPSTEAPLSSALSMADTIAAQDPHPYHFLIICITGVPTTADATHHARAAANQHLRIVYVLCTEDAHIRTVCEQFARTYARTYVWDAARSASNTRTFLDAFQPEKRDRCAMM